MNWRAAVKYLNQARRYGSKLAFAGVGLALPVLSFATPAGTYDGITSAVGF